MDRFGSFSVDHQKLQRGIYLSRVDKAGGGSVWTVDFRMRVPYKEKTIDEITNHSLEHLLASRMEEVTKTTDLRKVYAGQMGCCTGFYFLFWVPESKSEDEAMRDILNILDNMTEHTTESIPFNSELECGNCYSLARTEGDITAVNHELIMMNQLVRCCKYAEFKFNEYPYLED